jgi:hypothetical protein
VPRYQQLAPIFNFSLVAISFSFAHCVLTREYQSGLKLLRGVIRAAKQRLFMPQSDNGIDAHSAARRNVTGKGTSNGKSAADNDHWGEDG